MFSDVSDDFVGSDLEDVEMDGFGEGSAFSDDGDVSDLDIESGRAVSGDVSVSFFVSVVFGDVVKVVTSDDDGSLHFGGDDDTFKNFSSDGDIASEGTFFIDVVSFDGFLGGFESESWIFVVPDTG